MDAARKNRGFTLFELIVTIAVAAVIITFGVPGFKSLVQNSRATTDTNDLVTALNLGRSEATRRGVPIEVCSSDDGSTCSGNDDWSSGWIVRPAGGQVLRAWPPRSDANVLTADVDEIEFQPRGSLDGVAPTLRIRHPDCTGDQGRDVSVSVVGRISVARVACP